MFYFSSVSLNKWNKKFHSFKQEVWICSEMSFRLQVGLIHTVQEFCINWFSHVSHKPAWRASHPPFFLISETHNILFFALCSHVGSYQKHILHQSWKWTCAVLIACFYILFPKPITLITWLYALHAQQAGNLAKYICWFFSLDLHLSVLNVNWMLITTQAGFLNPAWPNEPPQLLAAKRAA